MIVSDEACMDRAIEVANRGIGWVNPNPLVGAVLVKGGRILAEGWHACYGGLHAERNALNNCREDPAGATLYVTLEPCCHYGKTPPCTEALIGCRIARVVIGMQDPNPLVAGKGIELLKSAGMEVVCGIREEVIREQNRVFLKYIGTHRPWVVMKTAMTLDGKIAAFTGDSRWVTGEAARHLVHQMRGRYVAVLVGSGTVKADDPLLNCRLEGKVRQPVRIVVDSKAGIALESRLVKTALQQRTVVAHLPSASPENLAALRLRGVKTLECREREGKVDIGDLLAQLGRSGVDSVLLEGGGGLNEVFLREGQVDEVYAFIAPKIIGGKEAKTPVEGKGFPCMSDAIALKEVSCEKIGEDILVKGKVCLRE